MVLGRVRVHSSRFWIYPLFFLAWQAAAIPLYQAEWQGAEIAAGLYLKDADDRRLYADGPIYLVLKAAQMLIPPDSSVAFLNPATRAEGEYYEGKVKYYLWPRHIVFLKPGEPLQSQPVTNWDSIVLFDPRGMPAAPVAFLDTLSFFRKSFELSHGQIYQAVYVKSK